MNPYWCRISVVVACIFTGIGCQSTRIEPMGCDYGLTRRCAHSPNRLVPNYYEDRTDCPTGTGNWTVAVHSETPKVSFEPANQSFPISTPTSPVQLAWARDDRPGTKGGWIVDLSTDFIDRSHPAGPGYFTWFVLMDHVGHGGGPLPRPNELVLDVDVEYSDSTPNGACRGFAGFTGFWDGKAHGTEVCFALNRWGDADPAPDVVSAVRKGGLEFVAMDGVPRGIAVRPGRWTHLRFDWRQIVPELAARGYFTLPAKGWANTITAAVYVGTEVNNFAPTGAASARLRVADFRVQRVTVQATSKPAP